MTIIDLQTVVLFLLAVTFINLLINIKLVKVILNLKSDASVNLLEDSSLPMVSGYNFDSKESLTVNNIESDKVLVFLQTNCPKCKSKLKHFETIISNAAEANVDVKIVLSENEAAIDRFIGKYDLKKYVLHMKRDDYLHLNPHQISPAYMFVNAENEIEVQGMIDDDNWQYFNQNIISV